MRAGVFVVAALAASSAWAEGDHFFIGPEQVWTQVVEGAKVMWIGPNDHERTQVLSGVDIKIVAKLTDPDSVAKVGVRALVAEVPASHSCEDLSDPLSYYVITLEPNPATEGPLTVCGGLEVGVLPGAIALHGDPEAVDAYWRWVPGQGFMPLAQ